MLSLQLLDMSRCRLCSSSNVDKDYISGIRTMMLSTLATRQSFFKAFLFTHFIFHCYQRSLCLFASFPFPLTSLSYLVEASECTSCMPSTLQTFVQKTKQCLTQDTTIHFRYITSVSHSKWGAHHLLPPYIFTVKHTLPDPCNGFEISNIIHAGNVLSSLENTLQNFPTLSAPPLLPFACKKRQRRLLYGSNRAVINLSPHNHQRNTPEWPVLNHLQAELLWADQQKEWNKCPRYAVIFYVHLCCHKTFVQNQQMRYFSSYNYHYR